MSNRGSFDFICFFLSLWAEWSDVPLLWVFSASSPSMKFYPRSFPLQKEHIPPSLPPSAHAELSNSAEMFFYQRKRVSRGHWKVPPPRDHSPSSFSIRINCWKTGMSHGHVWVEGCGKGGRDKMESRKAAWASQWGCLRPSGLGWTRHNQELEWWEKPKTRISSFLITCPQKAQPRPGNKTVPEHEATLQHILMLQWKHNRLGESQPPHRAHLNNFRITEVQQHIQRLLGYLRIQFRSC